MADSTTRIDDGLSTTIRFSLKPNIRLWEVELPIPGFSMGGAIDTNHMRRKKYVGQAPKKLKKMDDITFPCLFAENTLQDMLAIGGKNQLLTFTLPFGGVWEVWGWVEEFKPENSKIGEGTKAMVKIIFSCEDSDGNEVEPKFTSV